MLLTMLNPPSPHAIKIGALALFFGGVIATVVVIVLAYLAAKKDVSGMRRVPMTMCDVHGMYPTESSVTLDCPSVTSGQVELCPFCVLDRVKKKSVPNA